MNGYICLWRNRRIEVYADTSYAAQLKAAAILKAKKSYEITVVLAERAGDPVTHQPQELCP